MFGGQKMKKIMKVLCVILSLLMIFSLAACKEETPEPSSSVQSSSTPKKPNGQMVGEEGETAAGIWTGLVADGVAKGGGTRGLKLYYSYFTGKLDATQATELRAYSSFPTIICLT